MLQIDNNITPQWITEQMQDFQIKNPRQLQDFQIKNPRQLSIAITPQWITEQMQDFQIKNPRQLSIASGVRYESLTLALNGKRELSSEIKKTLYWYFRYLDAERQIRDFSSG